MQVYGFSLANLEEPGAWYLFCIVRCDQALQVPGKTPQTSEGGGNGGWQKAGATIHQLLIPGDLQAIPRWWGGKGHVTAVSSRPVNFI